MPEREYHERGESRKENGPRTCVIQAFHSDILLSENPTSSRSEALVPWDRQLRSAGDRSSKQPKASLPQSPPDTRDVRRSSQMQLPPPTFPLIATRVAVPKPTRPRLPKAVRRPIRPRSAQTRPTPPRSHPHLAALR